MNCARGSKSMCDLMTAELMMCKYIAKKLMINKAATNETFFFDASALTIKRGGTTIFY